MDKTSLQIPERLCSLNKKTKCVKFKKSMCICLLFQNTYWLFTQTKLCRKEVGPD